MRLAPARWTKSDELPRLPAGFWGGEGPSEKFRSDGASCGDIVQFSAAEVGGKTKAVSVRCVESIVEGSAQKLRCCEPTPGGIIDAQTFVRRQAGRGFGDPRLAGALPAEPPPPATR